MARISNTSWSTTFFYKEDLRSLYMNELYLGNLKAGIYNGNFCLYTVSSSDNGTKGVHLFIKKGTTFVFTNNYKLDSNNGYLRDISQSGDYIIKSVAKENIDVVLMTVESSPKLSALNLLGNGEDNPITDLNRDFYIVAEMVFDGDGDLSSDKNSSFLVPEFRCIVNNYSNRVKNVTPKDEDADLKNYIFKTYSNNTSDAVDYPIPDGSFDEDFSNLEKISYLIIGKVQTNTNRMYYTDGNLWSIQNADKTELEVANMWIQDHTFLARGLYDYRNNTNYDTLTPDVIIHPDLNALYLDFNDVYADNQIINKQTDYLDVNVFNVNKATDWTLNNEGLYTTLSKYKQAKGNTYKLVTDFLYLNIDKYDKNNNYRTKKDLSNLFTDENTYTLKSYQIISNIDYNNLNPISDTEGNELSSISWADTYSSSLNGKYLLQLDLNNENIKRLINIYQNKNVLSFIVDNMRKDEVITPETSSIIPVLMIFRKFQITDMGLVYPIDNISTENKFNPANVLSFVDLSTKCMRLSNLNVEQNLYTILPTIK